MIVKILINVCCGNNLSKLKLYYGCDVIIYKYIYENKKGNDRSYEFIFLFLKCYFCICYCVLEIWLFEFFFWVFLIV